MDHSVGEKNEMAFNVRYTTVDFRVLKVQSVGVVGEAGDDQFQDVVRELRWERANLFVRVIRIWRYATEGEIDREFTPVPKTEAFMCTHG